MNFHLPQPTPRVRSVGNAAATLQLMPQRINELAEQLGIGPAWYSNDVPFYAEADLERIRDHAAKTQGPRS